MGAGAWPARVHGRAPQRIRRPRPEASSAADTTPVAEGSWPIPVALVEPARWHRGQAHSPVEARGPARLRG